MTGITIPDIYTKKNEQLKTQKKHQINEINRGHMDKNYQKPQ